MTNKISSINVKLDIETNGLLASFAAYHNLPVSSVAAELIKEALELEEDVVLSRHGDARLFNAKKWISHEDAWK
ncbi:MAG: hypothetical protein WCJ33_00660 [Pseudomonadota bacterium]